MAGEVWYSAQDGAWRANLPNGTAGRYGNEAQARSAAGGAASPYTLDPDVAAFLQETSGSWTKTFDEGVRQFDAQQSWARDQFERQGLPQMAINQQLADMQGTQADRMYELALAQHETQKAQFEKTFGLQEKQFGLQQELGRGGIGLDYLKTAASLGGPESWAQSANFMRGARERSDVPLFLRTAMANERTPAYTAPGAAPSAPQSMGTLATGLGVAGTTGDQAARDTAMDDSLRQADALFRRGGGAFAPGVLESMDDSEKAMLGSAGRYLGYDVPAFLRTQQKSRIGQAAAQAF